MSDDRLLVSCPPARQHARVLVRVCLLFVLLAVPALHWPLPAAAAPPSALQISATNAGVRLAWSGSVTRLAQNSAQIVDWPLVEIGGAQVPAQLVALTIGDGVPVRFKVERLIVQNWLGNINHAEVITPHTMSGEARPALAAAPRVVGATAPVTLLREGRQRGQRIIVVAVSPLFERSGPQVVSELAVLIPGAALLDDHALRTTGAPFVRNAPGPSNPAASGSAWTARVTAAGIQRLSVAALAAAGVNLSDPSRLHLRRAGIEVALEERRTGGALDELRFYAPPPGDRWNAADTYWLTLEATPGLRMSSRSVAPGSATLRTTALEHGVWRAHAVYDTLLPGPDGDHWFAGDLRTAPDLAPATLAVPLTPTLPLASGTTTLTITGSAYTPNAHQLAATVGGASAAITWAGLGNWTKTLVLADVATSATLALTPGTVPDGIEPDSITWERSVTLDVGGRGATFTGVGGTWRYQLANTVPDRSLYDVSDPLVPAVLDLPAGTTTQFEDGPNQRTYLLAGLGTQSTPTLSAHASVDLATTASVLYIVPAALRDALAPLIAQRQAQQLNVATVDVQAIYDAWSYGQVAPDAIRAFLRDAASRSPAPTSVVLVGDGTNDPFDDTHKGSENINLIPPYLAMVDPYIGETACETCYAQLDGASPLDDPLPDLALGRLPVKSAMQLQTLVSKIIGYETLIGGEGWRSRVTYVADNYREADGQIDAAGDFAAFADLSAAQQPPGVGVQRIYYDPWGKAANGQPLTAPWREPNAVRARQKTLAAWNTGAGIINYVGHSHQWQWAFTGDPAPSDQQFLLYLNDADTLTNRAQLPILLEMTCLTSAFHLPAFGGSTLDERLLLASGGAAAVWGPTGEGVTHGHDALQRGFYTALWSGGKRQMGDLTTAGYLELFTKSTCCQDTLRTFALLGDPLTPAQVLADQPLYLPLMGRR